MQQNRSLGVIHSNVRRNGNLCQKMVYKVPAGHHYVWGWLCLWRDLERLTLHWHCLQLVDQVSPERCLLPLWSRQVVAIPPCLKQCGQQEGSKVAEAADPLSPLPPAWTWWQSQVGSEAQTTLPLSQRQSTHPSRQVEPSAITSFPTVQSENTGPKCELCLKKPLK